MIVQNTVILDAQTQDQLGLVMPSPLLLGTKKRI